MAYSRLVLCMLLVQCVISFVFRSPLRTFMPKSLCKAGRRPITGRAAFAHSTVSDVLQTIKSCVIVENNVPETLKKLIQYGDQWYLGKEPVRTETLTVSCVADSRFERVTGCTSVVQIKTSLVPTSFDPFSTGIAEKHQHRVQVEGSADSRVTQGMLAILCQVYKAQPCTHANQAKFVTIFNVYNS